MNPRGRLIDLNRSTLQSMALKALSIMERDEKFVLAVIAADEPTWRSILDKVKPGWEQELRGGDEQGARFIFGTFDEGFVDFLVAVNPENEAGIREPPPDGYVTVFVLAFGGIDKFRVRYAGPDPTAGVS